MLERINQRAETPHPCHPNLSSWGSCLRLIRALAVEIHEDWIEAHRYLNMDMLRE